MSFESRYYQDEAVAAIFAAWDGGARGTLACLATGLGKTVIMARVVERIVKGGGRVLLVAHRDFLLDDGDGGGAFHAVRRLLPSVRILFEQNVDRLYTADIEDDPPAVVLGMIQSVHNRLGKYPADFFTHMLVDEGHRCAAPTYLKVIEHFGGAKLLNVTATPGRNDGKTLKAYTVDAVAENETAGKLLTRLACDSIAYWFDAGAAWDDGWLVPIVPSFCKVDIDWTTLKMSGGDFTQEQTDKVMREDAALHRICLGLKERITDKPGLVFMPGVDSARGLASMLRAGYGIDAQSIDGKTDKQLRKEIIARFKAGDLHCLVNCQVAIEGFDAALIEWLGICRPTRSRSIYDQMLGRLLRPHAGVLAGLGGQGQRQERLRAIQASAKPSGLVIDFEGNLGNLPPPLRAQEVLLGELPHCDYGGQPIPTEANVRHVMNRRPDLSIQEARQRASDEQFLHDLIMAPRHAAHVEGEVQVQEFADYFSIPFTWQGKKGPREWTPAAPGTEASPKQLGFLRRRYRTKAGHAPSVEFLRSLTKRQAGQIIGRLNASKEKSNA